MANKIVGRQGVKGMVDQIMVARFQPDSLMKKAKIRYYNRAKFEGVIDPEKAPIDEICTLAGMDPHEAAEWWSNKGFDSWFRDRQHIVDKVDYLFEEALERAGYMIHSAEKESDSLAAMRFIADVKKELNKKKDEEEEAKVSPEQLEKLVRSLGFVRPEELPSAD